MRKRLTRGALVALLVALLALWSIRHLQDTGPQQPDAPAPPVDARPSPPADPADPADTGDDASVGRVAPPAPDAAPAVVQAQAASGVSIEVQRRPSLSLPMEPFERLYPVLLAGAEAGQPIAQYQLGQLLHTCRNVPEDPDALAAKIDRIHQTRRSDGWDVADPAQAEGDLRQEHARCRGVPQDARGRYRDWMRRAADQGLMEAQLNLMYHLPQAEYCQFIENCTPAQRQFMAELRERARRDVQAALEAGSVDALRTVGGWALNEEMGTPDPIEALAHFSAYDQIQRAMDRESQVEGMLSSLRRRLRPVDRDAAESRARELLSNPRCCQLTR